ncbi:MAG: efflux RND transporter periplasmic adaptor subunit [Draconibacterium sp.]
MKIQSKIIVMIFSVAVLIILASCGNKKQAEEPVQTSDSLIVVTKTQFETEKMALGTSSMIPFDQMVKCNGKIVAKSTGMAKISTPVAGIVQKINCSNGQLVGRGQVLFELSGNNLIEIQRDFTETSSMLKKAKSEFDRMKALYSEKVGTEKEYILAESEYKAVNARYAALKLKIEAMGLDAAKIEEGQFFSSFKILAPISGQISQINLSIGQFADPQNYHAEIIDSKQMQLQLAVFEKEVGMLQPELAVQFNLLSDTLQMSATLQSVGNMVDNQTKTVACYASLAATEKPLVNNAFTEASIIIGTDTLNAVPSEAIMKTEDEFFVLKLASQDAGAYYFEKVKVQPGLTNRMYTEVKNIHSADKLLVSGIYNLVIE